MIGDVVRCIDCGRPVRALGGAWCETHRPLDLTGGVMPWDRPTPRKPNGYAPTARAVYGEVPAMLAARGWERVDREGKAYWRSPATGVVHTQETARNKAFRVKVTRGHEGRPRKADDATALRWVEMADAGRSYRQIATEYAVSDTLVGDYIRKMRRVLRGAA